MIRLSEHYQSRNPVPLYTPGALVHHLRYDYRGVVVEVDRTCQASEEWYQANQTQPDRDQPWYHVFVDGGQQTTYVAQGNLEPDTSGEPISHPLVEHFFEDFDDGRYIGNDEPWPQG